MTMSRKEIFKGQRAAPGFDRLKVGAEVRYAEEISAKGPHASSVRVFGRQLKGGHHVR